MRLVKWRRRTAVFLIAVFAAAAPAASPSRQLTGIVIDKKTGQPVPEAIVTITEPGDAVPGDPDGRFEVRIPASSACTLTVTKSGYEKAAYPVDGNYNGTHIVVPLKKVDIYDLQDMKIIASGGKPLAKANEDISRINLSPELIARLPNAGQADVMRSLQLLPGVTGSNEMSSGLYVRGGTPDENLIVLDYMPIYYVDHFYGFFSAFNPRAVDGVTLQKGGFGAQWGGRTSGLVELSSSGKNAATGPAGIKAVAGTGLLCSDFFLQVPVGNNKSGSLMLAGRRAMTDVFKPDLFERIFDRMHGSDSMTTLNAAGRFGPNGWLFPDSITYVPQFHFWDVNMCAVFRPGALGKLSTSFFASSDRQGYSIDTAWHTEPFVRNGRYADTAYTQWIGDCEDTVVNATVLRKDDKITWGNVCIGQEWEKKWSATFATRLDLSYSRFLDEKSQYYFRTDTRTHRYSDTAKPVDSVYGALAQSSSTNRITDISCRFDNTLDVSDWNTLGAGIELSLKNIIYERDTAEPDTTSREYQSYYYGDGRPGNPHVGSSDEGGSWAVYAADEMAIGDRVALFPGVRLSYFGGKGAFALDPRLSGWWIPLPGLKVKAAGGMYTQEVHRAMEEDIAGGSRYVWLLTNKKRPLGKSRNATGGFSWENEHFLFDAEGYYKQLSGLITISERMRTQWEMRTFPFDPGEMALFEGSGTVKGLDVFAQVRHIRFPLLSKDAVYDGWAAYTLSRVENRYAVFNDGNPFPASHDHTHEVKLMSSLEWRVAKWSAVDFGAIWIYATGAPYTAPIAMYAIGGINEQFTSTYLYVGDKNGYRLPDYHRLDVSVKWKFRLGEHLKAGFTLGLFNAYNHRNILERSFVESTILGQNESDFYMGNEMRLFTGMDRKAMSAMPNAALDVTVVF